MPLNKATIGIIYTIVFPCKLGAKDGRIRNFTQTTIHLTKLSSYRKLATVKS